MSAVVQVVVAEMAALRAQLDGLGPTVDRYGPSEGLADRLDELARFVQNVEAEWAAGQRSGDCDTELELQRAAEEAQVRPAAADR